MQDSIGLLSPPFVDLGSASSFAGAVVSSNPAEVGAIARFMFRTADIRRVPRHPPTRAAFVPGLRDVILLAVVAALGLTASRALKRATGIPVLRQMRDMLTMWYSHGIDPPSYFELEMWKRENVENAPAYLTRYETKNGVFRTLNNWLPRPGAINEMSDKKAFGEICQQNGLPIAVTLLHVSSGQIYWKCEPEALRNDLFVKWRKGMGASHTLNIAYRGNGVYHMPDGREVNHDDLLSIVSKRGAKKDVLVQQHLHNHPAIASFAEQSILTMRVVTCMNEKMQPEVTLAMLRLLTKLEPQWKKYAKDMEYGNPVDLSTGTLGRCTGDSMRTSHLRYDRHPVTFEAMAGRMVPCWPETKELALAAHRAFGHRMVVGWDIAITPEGPVLMEGNTNFDVMFLQRVHARPIGHTRLGELLAFHISDFMETQRNGKLLHMSQIRDLTPSMTN